MNSAPRRSGSTANFLQFISRQIRITLPVFLSLFVLIAATVEAADLNLAPDCSGAYPSTETLWSPNHKFEPIEVLGVTDPDGDELTIAIQCILQDEPLDDTGDGDTEYDGYGIDTSTAYVRSERSGNENGRAYHIDYIATDEHGAQCGGEVIVTVAHNKKSTPIDDGRLYETVSSDNACGQHDINNPPIIYSEPVTFGQSWEIYQYDVDGHDPDQDVLTYSLTDAPNGMAIDADSGLITWTDPVPGEYSVSAMVDDGRDGTAEQTYTLTINGPPEITNAPPAYAVVDQLYQFTMTAEDPDSDPLTFSLIAGPSGMSIEGDTGLISWTPTESQLGTHTLTVQVADGRGGEDVESFEVTVVWPPTVTLEAEPLVIGCGEATLLTWTSEHAESCTISPEIGQVAVNGEQEALPAESTEYVITAEGHGGTATASVSITVMPCRTYTLDNDFDEGELDNLEHKTVHDQLQLSDGVSVLNFIWIANSGQGTVSKINTLTGEEEGRYYTGPTTGTNPSRTTVDSQGNLWVGNRNTASATKILFK